MGRKTGCCLFNSFKLIIKRRNTSTKNIENKNKKGQGMRDAHKRYVFMKRHQMRVRAQHHGTA